MNARQRRAAEYAASANRQAELKQEAAARRAIRAARLAGEGKTPTPAGTGGKIPIETPRSA